MPEIKTKSFVFQLSSILKSRENKKAIQWYPETKALKIKDQKRFTQTVLPKYFRHKKTASFVRQLNSYGFAKCFSQEQGSLFHHPNFDPYSTDPDCGLEKRASKKGGSVQKQNQSGQDSFWPHMSTTSSFNSGPVRIRVIELGKFESKLFSTEDPVTEARKLEELTEQVLTILRPLCADQSIVLKRMRQLRKDPQFKKLMRLNVKRQQILNRLGLKEKDISDLESELSIEEEMILRGPFPNGKSSFDSLKLLDSGNIRQEKRLIESDSLSFRLFNSDRI